MAEDKLIIHEIRNGNRQAFETLFTEYYDSLVSFAQSFLFDQQESEDLVQDLFVHVWESASRIEITTSVKAYFYQAIRNKCLNRLESIRVVDRNNLLYSEGLLQSGDIELFDAEHIKMIRDSIEELPEQMSRVIKLKLIEGQKREEIAAEMGISLNTVKTQIQRGKKKIRQMLSDRLRTMFLL